MSNEYYKLTWEKAVANNKYKTDTHRIKKSDFDRIQEILKCISDPSHESYENEDTLWHNNLALEGLKLLEGLD